MWLALLATLFASVADPSDEPARYTFYPLSGILGKDMFLSDAVDVDETSGVRDFDCGSYSYDGHLGIDVKLISFRQQDIGVPVYAALDGTVVEVQDGEPDRSLVANNTSQGNFVTLDHGGTHKTLYFHMRNGSVAVALGQHVSAGTQLGLAASSGRSSWPHLHFQSEHDGRVYEPHAGPCRQGPSSWTEQVPLQRAFYVTDFGFSPEPYEQSATFEGVAEDREPRTGTYVQDSTIHFRFKLQSVPVQTSYEMRLRRPDGTISATRIRSYDNTTLLRTLFSWGSFDLDPSVLGVWNVEIAFNGSTMFTAPFLVVASSSEIRNRPPNPIVVSIRPATLTTNDVPRCEVETSLVHEDPDYDVIAYRYLWTVGNRVVREVTSGGLMDALPRDVVRRGDTLVCRVTPNDGALDGPPASAQVMVDRTERRRAVRH